MGHEPLSTDGLRAFIGPPLINSFRELGFTEETAQRAVNYYRENYREKGMFQITPYEKIETTLAELSKHMMSSLLHQNQRYSQKEIFKLLRFYRLLQRNLRS